MAKTSKKTTVNVPANARTWSDGVDSARDAVVDAIEDARDGATNAVKNVQKYVQFGSAPEVMLRIRKRFHVKIPIAPDIVVEAGTDVPLQRAGDGRAFGKEVFNYKPNLQWRVTDSWFNGDINLDTMNHTVYYEKTFDLNPLQLKCSANFDYKDYEPYLGFQFMTTSGVTSPALQNGFSIRKQFDIRNDDSMSLSTDIEASLMLGGATLGRNNKQLKSNPATVDFSRIQLDLLLK